nr:MAG TPA: hypothetical protein [Caudoviricetes sp.]
MKTLATFLSSLTAIALYGALTTAPWQWFTTVVGVIVTVPMWVNVYKTSKRKSREFI